MQRIRDMVTAELTPLPAAVTNRADELFREHQHNICSRLDRLLAWLLVGQCIGGVAVAIWGSPLAWAGTVASVHPHVVAAVGLGLAIISLPIYLAWLMPGRLITRGSIALAEGAYCALFIHLTGGRIESHFMVFAALALVAMYRDWRVLLTISMVVATDHLIRGYWWPQSVYGTPTITPWRWIEHAAWVLVEDVFLLRSIHFDINESRRLARTQAELEVYAQGVSELVEQRTSALAEANRDLEAMCHQAQVADRTKSEFLANMSHEIRTPLTAIIGYTELLYEDGDLRRAPAARVNAIRTIQRNGEHLLGVINDILDLSRIEADRLTLEDVDFSPVQILQDVQSFMAVRATEKSIELRIEYETALPRTIRGDAVRMRQVLLNLVGNSVKFTEQGTVRLIARLVCNDSLRLEFDVVDTGIGMTEAQQAAIFQPFVQADTSTTRRFGGSGLGLVISKRIAEMMHGSISVLESIPGIGTKMRFCLPLESIDMANLVLPDRDRMTEVEEVKVRPVDVTMPAGTRVLFADDAIDNQRLVRFFLTKAGAEVVTVDNGQMAVDMAMAALDDRPFDVVLTDMQMPVMDGYEASALLRNLGYRGPIIALTAHAMAGDREKCLAAGCDDCVAKPIDRHVLIASVATAAAAEIAKRESAQAGGELIGSVAAD